MSLSEENTCVERVVALLRLARCSVSIDQSGDHKIILAHYQTPLGKRSTLGVFLEPGTSEKNRGEIIGLLESHEAQVDERVVFLDSHVDSPSNPDARIRFIFVDDLARQVFLSTGFPDICARELNEHIDSAKVIPVPARVTTSIGEVEELTDDARGALLDFARDMREDVCCVVGSFGSGKSVLIHSFAALCSSARETPESAILPLVVDLAGWGASGFSLALSRRVSEVFGTFAPSNGIGDLKVAFGSSMEL